MAQLGLDPDQMTRLAKTMKAEAEKIESAAKSVGGQLRSVWWRGKDADDFKGRWDGQHSKAIHEAAQLLRDASDHITRQVKDQRQASGA